MSGADKDSRYDSILNIRNAKEIVSLIYIKNFRNLAITNINETVTSGNVIELNISFKIIEFANVETVPEPLPEYEQTVTIDNNQGVQGTVDKEMSLSELNRLGGL